MEESIYSREYWLKCMDSFVRPILSATANNKLKETLIFDRDHRKLKVGYLEAVGRTLYGIAPFLAQHKSETDTTCTDILSLAQQSIAVIVDPKADDYCRFNGLGTNQPIVDSAFLASAIVDARELLYDEQDTLVQKNIVRALRKTSKMKIPCENNWRLFGAMIETCLLRLTGTCNMLPILRALNSFEKWYLGDGVYGDGKEYCCNYYNSFVIHPMLEEITRLLGATDSKYKGVHSRIVERMKLYCKHLEMIIAPDGSYPAVGRSITYRCGVFNVLSRAAYRNMLPSELSFGRVKKGLSAVLSKTIGDNSLFGENGMLNVGLYGDSSELAERYINRGSEYLCTSIFAVLGLGSEHRFWLDEVEKTGWEQMWKV